MSNITTVLLSPGCWDDDAKVVADLNSRLHQLRSDDVRPEIPACWELKNISEPATAWGGTKWPPALYAGALNHLPFATFAHIVAALPWSNPEEFQVMAMLGSGGRYRLLSLADLRSWPED